MKKTFLITSISVLLVTVALVIPCTGKATDVNNHPTEQTVKQVKSKGKVLVTYFTWPEPDGVDASSGASRLVSEGKLYGSTEYVARMIAEVTGGSLFAIKTEKKYPTPHKALIDEAKREAEAGERPRLTTHIKDLNKYDVIFVGYPNWWYDMPMAIYAFFDEYDFKGKTIIPFVTHGGSRFSESVETIGKLEPKAQVVRGPSVPRQAISDAKKSIHNWLDKQGLLMK